MDELQRCDICVRYLTKARKKNTHAHVCSTSRHIMMVRVCKPMGLGMHAYDWLNLMAAANHELGRVVYCTMVHVELRIMFNVGAAPGSIAYSRPP